LESATRYSSDAGYLSGVAADFVERQLKTNSSTTSRFLQSNGLAPSNDKESAVIMDLDPGSFRPLFAEKVTRSAWAGRGLQSYAESAADVLCSRFAVRSVVINGGVRRNVAHRATATGLRRISRSNPGRDRRSRCRPGSTARRLAVFLARSRIGDSAGGDDRQLGSRANRADELRRFFAERSPLRPPL